MERRSAMFLLIFSLVWSGIGSGADAYHLPFHPRDMLPLLPASIAMPVLRSLNSAVDLLPQFVGAVSSGNDTVVWNGTCFYQNEAYMEYVAPKEEGHNGGGILHIKVLYGAHRLERADNRAASLCFNSESLVLTPRFNSNLKVNYIISIN